MPHFGAFQAAQTLQKVSDNNVPHVLRDLCIRDAYAALAPADRELIDQEADNLAMRIKNHLGVTGGIELLAKLGMLLAKSGTVPE